MLGKRLINSNSAASGGSCTTDTLQILGDTSCIAYYKMSDATDESGNYDGTASNVNFNVAGKFGNAGDFNGSSSEMVAANSILPSSGGFAISWWQKTTQSDTAYGYTIDNSGGSLGNGIYIITHNVTNGLIVGFKNSSTFGSSLIPYTSAERTQWTHFCFSWDGTTSANAFKIYKNNVATSFTSTVTNNGSAYPFRIGRSYNGTDWFGGSIDNVRIFNKALSSNEVTTLNDEVYCVPTIVPTDYFNTVLYTGTNAAKSITSLNFQPDLIWFKSTSAYTHQIYDSIRGTQLYLRSNESFAEQNSSNQPTGNGDLQAFTSNGFNVGIDAIGSVNQSGLVSTAWNWKAGGADVQNTDGTITSQVSANVDAGFSIVSYTGNGNSSQQSYGHGLSSAPELLITKNRSTATLGTNSWVVGGTLLGNGGYMFLNATNAKNTASSYNGNQVPDSEVIYTSGTSDLVGNQNNVNFITYCFHSVDGYSKIGSYTGTGVNPGNFVTTNFEPRFLLVKGSDNTDNWIIVDAARNTSNPRNKSLKPNDSAAEATEAGVSFEFSSTGFKSVGDGAGEGQANKVNITYIFLAIA